MDRDEELLAAIRRGDSETAIRLIELGAANPAYNHNSPIFTAAKFNHLGLLQYLLRHPQVDPAAVNNRTLRIAAEEGHVRIVERLLQDPRVIAELNRTRTDIYPIAEVMIYGKSAVVPVLARVPGLLLQTVDHFLDREQFDSILKLAKMTGLKPEGDDIDFMAWSASIGALELLQTLIFQYTPLLTPADRQFLIACAQQYGHADIVDYLQKLPIVRSDFD